MSSLLLHFVNTYKSNKVVIYFEISSICVFSGAAVQPARHLLREFFDLCFLGYGGPTSETSAVRLAASRQLDRRSTCCQTGNDYRRQELISAVRPVLLYQSNDDFQAVRPVNLLRSDRDPSNLRVNFDSAKTLGFWAYKPFIPLWLV